MADGEAGAGFFGAAFFPRGDAFFTFAASARFSAQRRFRAARMAFLPAAESFRFGLCSLAGAAGSDSPLTLAHRAFCARAIFRLEAAENFLRLVETACGAMAAGAPDNIALSSAICRSIFAFSDSKPTIAASIIALFSLVGM